MRAGRSTIDESSFTGEPLPVTKLPGVIICSMDALALKTLCAFGVLPKISSVLFFIFVCGIHWNLIEKVSDWIYKA